MRRIRWKKAYLTGDPRLDERNLALLDLLGEFHSELSGREHCQEINDLAVRFIALAKNRLERLTANPDYSAESDDAIGALLRQEFPLAALNSPACKSCGLCDRMAERLSEWIATGSDRD